MVHCEDQYGLDFLLYGDVMNSLYSNTKKWIVAMFEQLYMSLLQQFRLKILPSLYKSSPLNRTAESKSRSRYICSQIGVITSHQQTVGITNENGGELTYISDLFECSEMKICCL
jgi:hypothetical protein